MKTPEKDNTPYRDLEFDSEYIGNIWGWKFSMFGLALIVILSVLMFWRHDVTGTEPGFEKMEAPADKLFKKKATSVKQIGLTLRILK